MFRIGCLIVCTVMLLGCAKHIENGVEGPEVAPLPANGSPAANAAGAMLSPLTSY